MTIKEIDQALEEGRSLKQVAQAYSDIANLKIKRLRKEVLRNRLFFKEISGVYALVKKLAIKKKINIAKPKKIVTLLLTSNYRFYGNINSSLIDFFIKTTQKFETDKIILGKAGIDFFRAAKLKYREVLLRGDQPTGLELTQLVDMIKDYNQVLVFYSSLKSLLIQIPTVNDITASSMIDLTDLNAVNLRGQKEAADFIFEPELPKILSFFDSQILTLLLEDTFLESGLSRTASRFISMDQAEIKANRFISEYEKLKGYAKSNLINNQILENFASNMAVRKELQSDLSHLSNLI